MEQFKVMRAWDKGHNKIRYVYHDENMKTHIGETTFLNWFYVKTEDYNKYSQVFKNFINNGSLVKCENDGLYTKCFYNTVHESEFLTKDMEYDWGYKNYNKNQMLEKLSIAGIQTYEADVSMTKRWLLQNNVTVEDDYKVLYYDIETDDRHGGDSLTPGKYRILCVAMKSSDNHNADGKMMWLYCHEDTDEAECEFLQKVAKVFRAHDCIIAFNGSNFDDLYIKSRFARYGIEIDWRTKFLQDACWTFKKYGPNLPSHKLDYIGNYILKRGKVEHEGESIYGMWQNNLKLLKEYNIEDVQLMYDIECKTGYLNAHRGVCSVGMTFVDDLYILHKIDNFVLKQAAEDKHYHFKTIVRNNGENDENETTYEGAFVFDPVPGLHEHVKVLDFSSLYPNVINTFNISPDTFIEPSEIDSIPSDKIITTATQHKFRKDFVGILPKVVMALKAKRDYWKEKMSHETPGTVMHKVYDRMQYLYKYFGLSFYGCLGEKHSRFYDTRVAETVTLTGQMFTKTCAKWVQSKHNAQIIYGDSVTGERCTVIRDTADGLVKVISLQDLFDIYSDYYIENINGKEYKTFNLHKIEALSYNFEKNCSEFKPVKCVMRHKTDKTIYSYHDRNNGMTYCTEDHSLIDKDGNEFKPTEHKNGFSIDIPDFDGRDDFFGFESTIDDDLYISYDILNLPKKNIPVKLRELCDYRDDNRMEFTRHNVYNTSIIIQLLKRTGYSMNDIKITCSDIAFNLYDIVCSKNIVNCHNAIPHVEKTRIHTKDCYVYDLTVEDNHNFVDAMGNLLLHNTDSFFFHDDYYCDGHDRIEDLSKELSKVCHHLAVKKNNCDVCTLKMSYDKSFKKYLILNGKKRYAGVLDFLDGHVIDDFNMYVAGFEYKRTDSCKFVKEKQYEMLKWILTDTPDSKEIRNYILNLKQSVCSGKLSIDDITFAQKLTKNVDEYADQIHVRVAREMQADGHEVYVGDKIPYFILAVDREDKPIAKPIYKFDGKYSTKYYWNNKMFPPLKRILEVVYPNIDWESYLVSGGKNVSYGRSNLW